MCRVGWRSRGVDHPRLLEQIPRRLPRPRLCGRVGLNLGALTTNSDLKKRLFRGLRDSRRKAARKQPVSTKVGSLIGDHTKTSIGTLMNTGANRSGPCASSPPTASCCPSSCRPSRGMSKEQSPKGFGRKKVYETRQDGHEPAQVYLDRGRRGPLERGLRHDRPPSDTKPSARGASSLAVRKTGILARIIKNRQCATACGTGCVPLLRRSSDTRNQFPSTACLASSGTRS